MKISFIIKIIVNRQIFHYLLILSLIIKITVYHRNYRRRQNIIVYRLVVKISSCTLSSSKYHRVPSNSSFMMETIVTSRSTWIVETISRVWEAMKIKVKTVANSLGWESFGNYDGVPFNFAIKLYIEH